MQEKTRKVYFNCIFNPIWFVYLVCIALSLYSSHHNYFHTPFYPLASRPHRDHSSTSKNHHKHTCILHPTAIYTKIKQLFLPFSCIHAKKVVPLSRLCVKGSISNPFQFLKLLELL